MPRLPALVLSIAVLTGCASSSVGGTSPPAHRTVSVGFAATGRTVRLSVGDSLKVSLGSTYWQFARVTGRALTAGRPVTRPAKRAHMVPGSGAGTVIMTYRADRSGAATVAASRTSCGEVLRCTGGQGAFRLTVVVR